MITYRQTIFLELNEINFNCVRQYVAANKLPGFARLIEQHGLTTTVAEDQYEHLEPWIQWVTVHTGKDFGEHGVFRLGDMVGRPLPQLFEQLEERGLTVGAVSPMNTENRLRRAPYFVPDPWTNTPASGSRFLRRLATAISKAVNSNAHGRPTVGTALTVLAGILRFAPFSHYPRYANLLLRSLRRHWSRAMLLDLLLFDVHNALYRKHQPELSVLFLNTGAHIQHHYFFNSAVIEARGRNPEWYLPADADPVLEIYELYDWMVSRLRARFPEARLIVATGLRQEPYPEITFYYRLRDHAGFLQRAGIEGVSAVEPRMSRDFLVHFETEEHASRAEKALREAADEQGQRLFEEVDNRGRDVFVTLTWPTEVERGTRVHINGNAIDDLYEEVSLVAIKNGHHDTIGYVLDTGRTPEKTRTGMPLRELYGWVVESGETA